MKHRYVFVQEHSLITRATRFHFVNIGEGVEGQKILSLVRLKFENDKSVFFARYSSDICNFLLKVAASLGYETYTHFAAQQVTQLTDVDFVSSFIPSRRRCSTKRRFSKVSAYPSTK